MRAIRTMTVSILAIGLLVGSGIGVAAQDASPPPWFGGRAETRLMGFAVTVPDGWAAMDPWLDVEQQRQVIGDTWGEEFADSSITDAFGDIYLLSGPDVTVHQACDFTIVPEGWSESLVEFAELESEAAEAGTPLDRDIKDIRTLEVEAGPATVVDYLNLESDRLHFATYVIELDGQAVRLTCVAVDQRPEDDWLSLADSFEVLPAE